MFVLGCKDLIVATDHQPLLGIFNDRGSWDDYESMHPRSQMQNSQILANYSVLLREVDTGPDAMSRYPTAAAIENNPEMPSPGTTSKTEDVLDVIRQCDTPAEKEASDE